jgi:hypothetical protein
MTTPIGSHFFLHGLCAAAAMPVAAGNDPPPNGYPVDGQGG